MKEFYRQLRTFLFDRRNPNEKQREELRFVAHISRWYVQDWDKDNCASLVASSLEDLVDSVLFAQKETEEDIASEVDRQISLVLSWVNHRLDDA